MAMATATATERESEDRVLKIGLAFDLAPAGPTEGPDDRYEEFDRPETITALADVLRSAGHEVVFLGDGRLFLERVLAEPPDLVWNMAEGEGVGRCRESRVPAVLEMLGIPCTGSDPLTLAASLDKDVAKRLVRAAGVHVPDGLAIDPGLGHDRTALRDALAGLSGRVAPPWIVKPAFEGSSKGIRAKSLVDDEEEAIDLLSALIDNYGQPILVEEFVAGDEVTVGLIGAGADAEVLGTMRVVPLGPADRFVYSLDAKRAWQTTVRYEVPADLPGRVIDRLERSALDAYRALGCRDVARIDFRVRDGIPYFLEANPLPGLSPGWGDLVILARGVGLSHEILILRILAAALKRVGLIGTAAGGSTR